MFVQGIVAAFLTGILTVTGAAPTLENRDASSCPVATIQAVQNHGFEQGTADWTFTGGASVVANGDKIPFGITTSDGTHFGFLISNSTDPTSSISQTLTSSTIGKSTLSFDWWMQLSTTDHGPPRTECTLTVTFGESTITSLTFLAASASNGSSATTFDDLGGGDVLTFSFSSTDLDDQSQCGCLVDRVKLVQCPGNY